METKYTTYNHSQVVKLIYRLYIRYPYMKQFIITKKIAKHGSQAIIVVPRVLEQHLKPRTLVKITIDIIEDADEAD